MQSPRTMSLATMVALVTALVTAGSMAAYAVIQYQTQNHTVLGLVFEHGWHVVVLGAITYLVLFFVLHRTVVRPIHALYVKFYAVTRGHVAPIHVSSRIKEIGEICDGVNMMLTRIGQSASTTDQGELVRRAHKQLCSVMSTHGEQLAPEVRQDLDEVVGGLDRLMAIAVAEAVSPNDAGAARSDRVSR